MEFTDNVKRRSPVTFATQPLGKRLQDGWEVVCAYHDEGSGPFLVDLSHRPKWDVQHGSLSTVRPWGLMFPEAPGQCRVEGGRVLSRVNHTQAALWGLTGNGPEPTPEPYFTDVTDGLCLLALVGAQVLPVMEKVSSLDLTSPKRISPFLVQGPVLHIPCQVVVIAKNMDLQMVFLAFSRGYGQAMAEALLKSGKELGLRPGGEDAFTKTFGTLCPN